MCPKTMPYFLSRPFKNNKEGDNEKIYRDIPTSFGNTQRMRLSNLRKQRPTLISMSWANTSPLLAMKQTYVTMSLLGLYLAFGTKNIRLSVQHSRMVKLRSTV